MLKAPFLVCLAAILFAALTPSCTAQEEPTLITEETLAEPDAYEIVKEYYASIDAGSTDAVDEYFADDSSFAIFMMLSNGTKVFRNWEGKENIENAFEEWYAARGDVLEPTTFHVLAYQFPLLLATGSAAYSNHGQGFFTQAFVFRQGKIYKSGLLVRAGMPEEPSAEPPAAAVDLLRSIYDGIDVGDMSVPLDGFSESAEVGVVCRNDMQGSTSWQKSTSTDQLAVILEQYYAFRQGPTKTQFTVIRYQHPAIFVAGTISSAENSEELGRFISAYMLDDSTEDTQFARAFCVLDWSKEVLPSTA